MALLLNYYILKWQPLQPCFLAQLNGPFYYLESLSLLLSASRKVVLVPAEV